MKKINYSLSILLVSIFWSHPANAQYGVYVHNASTFYIKSTGNAIKGAFGKDPNNGGGITSGLKPDQVFFFYISPTKGGLPKGVEGSISFSLNDPKFPGTIDISFENPLIGSSEFSVVNQSFPFALKYLDKSKLTGWALGTDASTAIEIYVDTTQHTINPNPLNSSGSSSGGTKGNNGSQNMEEPIPAIINFDWKVSQRMRKEDDDDNNGKAYKEVTYLFTSNGDYAAVKPEDASFDLMVYSKKGNTWIFDDKKKTITVMNMPKTVGEGAAMGKAIAEDIKKSPLQKDKDDEKITITKTGKTKPFLGYTADQFEIKNNKIATTKSTSQTESAFFWYCTVPFDPVKVYTMGVGRPADISKLQNDPKMKNNMTAIPVLNKNYLWVETEAGNIKGMEVTEIKRVNTTIYTAGYTIKVMKGLKDMIKGEHGN